MNSRVAGVTLPLSSIRSARDWGIGELGDLAPSAAWLGEAGFRVVQLLPVYELARGETSPYGARTAFGIDPIFLSIADLEDWRGDDTAQLLGEDAERERLRLRGLAQVDFVAVRDLKNRALAHAFEHFYAEHWTKRTERAEALTAFIASERAWEDDLALYVAIREEHNDHGWQTWPDPLRHRAPDAMQAARERLSKRVLRHQYEQWQLASQWAVARTAMESLGMKLMGDLPFVVGSESADVWAHPELFQLGRSLGAPPDDFTPAGQDWGLPPYDWEALARTDFDWLRARVRHAARLYHAFRVDHLVGYFRQYVRKEPAALHALETGAPPNPARFGDFDPRGETSQSAHGANMLRMMQDSAGGAAVIAEDLGVIPDFVRSAMRALKLPGYKVILWERDQNRRLRDPASYDALSVATWSTHDTQPLGAWWHELTQGERDELLAGVGLDQNASAAQIDEALFGLLTRSGSNLALVLITELLAESKRINTPGTVGPHNWTYRMPKSLESLRADPSTNARRSLFLRLLQASGRA